MNASLRTQKGVALFMAVFALMLLSAIAFGMMYMTNTETSINANYRSSQQAYFAALAGMAEVRERMTVDNTGPHRIAPPAAVPGGPNTVLYVINPTGSETIDPVNSSNPYFDDELCKERYAGLNLTDPGAGRPCTAASSVSGVYAPFINSDAPFTATSAALPYKWVRVTMKANNTFAPYYVDGGADSSTHNRAVCWNGLNELVMPPGYTACDLPPVGGETYKPVYVLTAYAKGSRRITQAEVAPDPPLLTKAAVDSQDAVILNGNLTILGYDYCSCDCTTTGTGNSRVTTCVDRSGKTCDRSHYGIYSADDVQAPNSSQHIAAGTVDENGNPEPVAEYQEWTYNIPGLIARYKNYPGAVPVTGSPYNWTCNPNCGTRSSQQFGLPPAFPPSPVDNPLPRSGETSWNNQITYIPGNVQLTSGATGAGILIVDGDLDVHGGMEFYGLVLVKGVISFTGGASSSVNIYGAVLAGLESRVDTVLGGSATIKYNRCALPKGRTDRPPVLITSRELNY